MPRLSKKPSFGHDLVEAMKLVLAHRRGEIELKQVWPWPRPPKSLNRTTKPVPAGRRRLEE